MSRDVLGVLQALLMPGKRAPGQKMITFWADAELLRAVDAARIKPPRQDRSQFIRASIVEKLERLGYQIDRDLALAPDRASSNVIPMDAKRRSIAVVSRVAEKAPRYGAKPKKKK